MCHWQTCSISSGFLPPSTVSTCFHLPVVIHSFLSPAPSVLFTFYSSLLFPFCSELFQLLSLCFLFFCRFKLNRCSLTFFISISIFNNSHLFCSLYGSSVSSDHIYYQLYLELELVTILIIDHYNNFYANMLNLLVVSLGFNCCTNKIKHLNRNFQ